ncbi:hypothetical protein F383_12008 [Gossypium arboreum]|uniref:Uncharacterized protein n=1 Tax=Gossypium arboreum TaxID=29729 RepID=A0A0B0PVJ3_GOSAR|nr:hypothetical protein F383_12008 [Gossypium arboreum]
MEARRKPCVVAAAQTAFRNPYGCWNFGLLAWAIWAGYGVGAL